MKRTLSILLSLAFLFSLGALPASAQAAARPTSMAYLSLISPESEASLPVKVQAHSAFEKLLPRLAQVQAKGQIVAFKPEYAFGMVKVQYPSGTDLAAALRLGGAAPAIFDTPKAALEYSQVGERMASNSVTYTAPYVNLNLYESCLMPTICTQTAGTWPTCGMRRGESCPTPSDTPMAAAISITASTGYGMMWIPVSTSP